MWNAHGKLNLVVVTVALFAVASCGILNRGDEVTEEAIPQSQESATTAPFTGVQAALSLPIVPSTPSPVGIRDFRAVYEALINATGIRPTSQTDAILVAYRAAQSQLALNGDPMTVNSQMLLSVGSLGSLFCDRMLGLANRRLFSTVNLTLTPASLTPVVRRLIANEMARGFWQRATATDAEFTLLSTSIDEALVGQPTTAQTTRNVVLLACAAGASAIDFVKNF